MSADDKDAKDEGKKKVPITGERPAVAPPADAAAAAPGGSPSFFWSQDLVVVLGAIVLLAVGWVAHAEVLGKTKHVRFDHQGLSFQNRPDWLAKQADLDATPFDIVDRYQNDPARLEVQVDAKPLFDFVQSVNLTRSRKYDFYYRRSSERRMLNGKEWLRTEFSYVSKEREAEPRVAYGIEYAIVNGEKLYVVTASSTDVEGLKGFEKEILSTLWVK